MPKYKIKAEFDVIEVKYYEIEADSEQEAIDKVKSDPYDHYDSEIVEDIKGPYNIETWEIL